MVESNEKLWDEMRNPGSSNDNIRRMAGRTCITVKTEIGENRLRSFFIQIWIERGT